MNPDKDYSLDDIQSDIIHLRHLIDETISKLHEIDHSDLRPGVKHYVDRACAFTWVARDLVERIEGGFSEACRAAERWRAASTIDSAGSINIPALYRELLAVGNRDVRQQTDDEAEASHQIYVELQNLIITAEPKTPRDVAIQFLADTHEGESDMSQIFEKRIREIAALPEAVGNAQEASHA